jgi:hypothetical protein
MQGGIDYGADVLPLAQGVRMAAGGRGTALEEFESENAKLKRLVSDLSSEKLNPG